MTPDFTAARVDVADAMLSLSSATLQLRVEGAERQHPFYYRAAQFARQLEEFRTDLARAATDAIPLRRAR